MGDFNTLSSLDASCHDDEHLLEYLLDESIPSRFRLKYLNESRLLSYEAMDNLLHRCAALCAGAGVRCVRVRCCWCMRVAQRVS
jgi:hypothetical protein